MLTLIRNENQYIIKHLNVNIPLCLCAVKNILTRYKYLKKKSHISMSYRAASLLRTNFASPSQFFPNLAS